MGPELFYWIKQLNINAYEAGVAYENEDWSKYNYHTDQREKLLLWIRKELKEE